MWKYISLFLVVALTGTSAQDIVLECRFHDWPPNYVCLLENITVLDRLANVTFGGTHQNNKTDDDVNFLQINLSNTPFIINQIFTTFPNLIELAIHSSNLESIVIPPEFKLQILSLSGNNILRIKGGWLRNQTQLVRLFAPQNSITRIDDDAFEDLLSLRTLDLHDNKIEELTPQTLASLTRVTQVNFETNLLTSIGKGVFSQNANITHLILFYNRIDKIHPSAFTNLRNLFLANLYGNECVSSSFYLQEDSDRILMNNMLQRCFKNYLDADSQEGNVTRLTFDSI